MIFSVYLIEMVWIICSQLAFDVDDNFVVAVVSAGLNLACLATKATAHYQHIFIFG